MSLLKSQDGGILTVRFSRGNPEAASPVLLLFWFNIKSSYPFEIIFPLRFCQLSEVREDILLRMTPIII